MCARDIIVITDRLNHRVQCFTIDGQFTATLNIADNQFLRGVFVTADQSVIITTGSGGSDKIVILKEEMVSYGKPVSITRQWALPWALMDA